MANGFSRPEASVINRIRRRYNSSIFTIGFLGSLALVLLVGVQGWFLLSKYQREIADDLTHRVATLQALHDDFNAQLTAMRETAESYYGEIKRGADAPRNDLVLDADRKALTLDHLNEAERHNRGNIFAVPDADAAQVAVANLLFNIQAPFHDSHFAVRLSYFTSESVTTIYPWTSLFDLEQVMGMDMHTMFEQRDAGAFEFWSNSLPQNNPERKMFWTSPYLDIAGNGIMVTYAAPVYDENAFLGVIASDITLSTLSETIRMSKLPGGKIILIDGEENVIAASDMSERVTEFIKLDRALGTSIAAHARGLSAEGGMQFATADGFRLYVSEIKGTPWRLIYVLEFSELLTNVLLMNFLDVALVTVIFALSIFALHLVITRSFFKPAMSDVLQIEGMRQMAEQSSRDMNSLLANASHDLRQPLQAMHLFIYSLVQREQDADKLKIINSVRASMETLNELLNTLLDVSKLEAGKVTPEFREELLDEILARVERDLGPLAQAKGLELNIVPSDLSLETDPALLAIVLRNLVGNAIKYTEQGSVRVGGACEDGIVYIKVEDDGPGIPADQIDLIFEDFQRLKREGGQSVSGLGLGLGIVQRVTTLLGGKVECRSQVGKGSTFWLEFPLKRHP